MDYLPYSQEYMLAVSIMGGMLLGFIWDIYRLIRHYVKLNNMGTAIGDIVYWILSIYIGVLLIFDLSYGNIRFFILMGFLVGALLYFYGISRYILKVFIFVVDSILKIIKNIIDMLIKPVKFILNLTIKYLNIVLNPVKIKYEKAKKTAKKRYKFLKFKLKKVSKNRKMVYNKKKQLKRLNKRRKGQRRIERRAKNYRTKEKN